MWTDLKKIAVHLICAALVGNFVFLWQVNARLSAIETAIKYMQSGKTLAEK